jgi:hypothetical protein
MVYYLSRFADRWFFLPTNTTPEESNSAEMGNDMPGGFITARQQKSYNLLRSWTVNPGNTCAEDFL